MEILVVSGFAIAGAYRNRENMGDSVYAACKLALCGFALVVILGGAF